MLLRLHVRLMRCASGRRLVLLLAAALPLLLAINFIDLPFSIPRLKALSGGFGILDLELFYTADTAYRYLAAFGAEGRRLYALGLLTLDVLLPALMSLILAVALTLVLRRQKGWPPGLNLLPLSVLGFDYLENAALLALLAAYPQRLDGVGALAGLLTLAKHGSVFVCLGLVGLGTLRSLCLGACSACDREVL